MEVSPIARCSCDGNTCRCLVKAGDGIVVTGSGQMADPYVIISTITDFSGALVANDTDTVNLTVVGSGTSMDPFIISGTSAVSMLNLTDVDDPAGPALGDVPVFNGSKFEFAPPPTVPPGLVNAEAGIVGDGTLATPLRIAVSNTALTTTAGLATYIDSAGQLRADASSIASNVIRSNASSTRRQAVVADGPGPVFDVQTLVSGTATSIFTIDNSGSIATGFIPWDQVTRRPTSFTPSTHTQDASTITAATLSNLNQRQANDLLFSRVDSMAGFYGYTEKATRGPHTGRAVMDLTATNAMSLYWSGGRPVVRVDASDIPLATVGDIQFRDSMIAGKANSYWSQDGTRYAQGPTGIAYGRGMEGSGWFSVWMDNTLQFGRNTSSRRFKEDIEPFDISMDQVLALGERVVSYHRKGADDRYEVGMIAEEVNPILPWAVTWFAEPDVDENGVAIPGMSSSEPKIDGLRYDLLSLPALVGVRALHEQQAEEAASWKRKHDLVLARLRKIEAALGLTDEED